MSKVFSVRVSDEVAAWVDEYAGSRGVKRADLLEQAVASFKVDCERGVPEIRAAAARQSSVKSSPEAGVGDCPDRPGSLGHVWMSPAEDPRRSCRFCGTPGRGNHAKGEGGFLSDAGRSRSELFSRLRTPDSAKGIKPKEKDKAA